MLYNLLVTRQKTIRLATPVALGLAVLGGFACRSAEKIEATEPASVPQVTAIEPPAGARPIRLEAIEPSGTDTRQFVIEDDDLKLSEVRELLTAEISRQLFLWDQIDDDLWRIRFGKRGAWTPPDIIHEQTWEDVRASFLLAPPPGK